MLTVHARGRVTKWPSPSIARFAELAVHLERLSANGIWTAASGQPLVSQGETVRIVATGLVGLSVATFTITSPSETANIQESGADLSGLAFIQVSVTEPGGYNVRAMGRDASSFLSDIPFIGAAFPLAAMQMHFAVIAGQVPKPAAIPELPSPAQQVVGAVKGVGEAAGGVVGGVLSGLTPTLLIVGGILVLVAMSPAGRVAAETVSRRYGRGE